MRVLLFGCKDPREAVGALDTLDRGFLRANSGNLMFNDGAFHAVSAPGTEVVVSDLRRVDPAQVDAEFDHVVLPLANAFRPQFADRLAAMTRLLKRITVPATVLGVGAQSSHDFSTEQLAPGEPAARRFASAALDRGPSIGVRGAFTAEWLRSLGFADVEVIGCPSMFRHGPELPRAASTLEPGALDGTSRVVLAMDRHDEGAAWDLARRALGAHPRLEYVAQTTADLELLLWGRSRREPPASWVPTTLDHPLLSEDRTRFFLDVRTWVEHLRGADFVVGTRIHGNLAAILAGATAHVITHDSRTRELAEHFELPSTPLHRVLPSTTVADLHRASDTSRTVAGHPARFAAYTAFLEQHGIPHTWAHGGATSLDERLVDVVLPGPVRSLAVVGTDEVSARLLELADSRDHARRSLREARAAARQARTAVPGADADGPATGLFRRRRR